MSNHHILVQHNKAVEIRGGKAEFVGAQSTWKSGGGGEEEAPHLPGGFDEWL